MKFVTKELKKQAKISKRKMEKGLVITGLFPIRKELN